MITQLQLCRSKDAKHPYWWRVKAGNGQILCTSETYKRKYNACKTLIQFGRIHGYLGYTDQTGNSRVNAVFMPIREMDSKDRVISRIGQLMDEINGYGYSQGHGAELRFMFQQLRDMRDRLKS